MAKAQIVVSLPFERNVFQRNEANEAYIPITGTLGERAERIEARLVPRVNGQGVATDWITIDSEIDGNSFTGKILGKGGWYNLELRLIKDNSIKSLKQVNRIGIGEVFMVCGQSNAQGLNFPSFQKSATDDRVNAYSFYLDDYIPENLQFGPGVHIESADNVGIRGKSAWIYGELGDKIASQQNVPVMFFNTAFEGTSISNWANSAKGLSVFHEGFGFNFVAGFPYNFLRIGLQNYNSLYGIRSILWHQGENDRFNSLSNYYTDLKFLIDKTRQDFGAEIPWVVARVSLNQNTIYPQIIEAQNLVIQNTSKTFAGPLSDEIQNPRADGVHFANLPAGASNGLSDLATAWFNSLNQNFYANANPILGYEVPKLKINCNTNNSITLSVNTTFSDLKWSNGTNSTTLIATNGEYSATVKSPNGRYFTTNKVLVQSIYPVEIPVVSFPNGIMACKGGEITLNSSTLPQYSLNWNNGDTRNTIIVKDTNPYFVQYRNKYGCLSSKSNEVRALIVDPPLQPIVNKITPTLSACEGNSVVLSVYNPNKYNVAWSNGNNTDVITVKTPGVYNLNVVLSNATNCKSIESDTYKVSIFNNPATPELKQSGPYYLEASTVKLPTFFEWSLESTIDKSFNTQQIAPNKSGFYSVKGVDTYKIENNETLNLGLYILSSRLFEVDRRFKLLVEPLPTI